MRQIKIIKVPFKKFPCVWVMRTKTSHIPQETEKQLRRMQDQLREEEKKLFNQADTFENFADDSEGEVKEVKSKNPRIVGAMEASDTETEVCSKHSLRS